MAYTAQLLLLHRLRP